MKDYELLGSFYLGCRQDPEKGTLMEEPILYDSKDLTTHAVCVGMTGSGKTGLGIALLEEAAIDGVPSIVIDPKGDMANLFLTFPDLNPENFQPWIDEAEASRQGRTSHEQAEWTSNVWRKGLGQWGQSPERIRRFSESVQRVLYTPGSTAARPIALLRSLNAPTATVIGDPDLLRSKIQTTVSGLLGLLGIDSDPLRSREHILLSTLIDSAWREGKNLDLAGLIRSIQSPPFDRVGVFDLESFFPGKDRFELAMMLNNLLASPGFSVWTEGDPLDIGKLLYADNGKPKMSILSIAHLSEAERMFFVTLLLNEVLSWMRSQPGSTTLRALLYMDEIFGYFPPTANPPSKTAMLTLLKQARAYGLGIVLATQNPVDLDYKGLSNAGTWFIGRLQTERDKMRVMEGLEGAAASQAGFDRQQVEQTLAGLGNRVFLMNNVHEDAPVLFSTRWVLSYLSGPLSLEQIKKLNTQTSAPASIPAAPSVQAVPAVPSPTVSRPILPPPIEERFLPQRVIPGVREKISYRPALLGTATVHYSDSRAGIDEWKRLSLLAPLAGEIPADPWTDSFSYSDDSTDLLSEPMEGIGFEDLPAEAQNVKAHEKWKKMLATHLYQDCPLVIWKSKSPALTSQPGETEEQFQGRLRQAIREERDLAIGKVRSKYETKILRLQDRIRAAQERVSKEESEYKQQQFQTAISFGSTVMGALFGRKLGSVTNLGKAATAMRGIGRAASQKGDIERAEDKVETLLADLQSLESEVERELTQLRTEFEGKEPDYETREIRPKKTDTTIDAYALVWTPWATLSGGSSRPVY
jgi:hypothetical protein